MADKQILARYVHDAVEMEVCKHTLNGLRHSIIYSMEQHIKEKKENLSSLKYKYEQETREINIYQYKKHLSELEKEIKNKNASKLSIANDRFYFHEDYTVGWILVFSISFIILSVFIIEFAFSNAIDNTVAIVGGFIGAPIGYWVSYIMQKKHWKKKQIEEIEKINKLISELNTKQTQVKQCIVEDEIRLNKIIEKYNKAKELSINELAKAENIYNERIPHIESMDKQLKTMNSQLNTFYNENLIPPDYRFLECVIAFDQMFHDELVDTIKDAILLYEDRVFRGEMIKGLDNIKHDIKNLGEYMAGTVSILTKIENDINRMSDDLYKLLSDTTTTVSGHLAVVNSKLDEWFGESTDNQSDIFSELEYSRYANDAIRANSDRMIWYAEQHRQGLL